MNITGYISDNNGIKLINANIYFSNEKGEYKAGNAGTVSDETGYYSISGVGDYLTASYTGYKKEIKKINGHSKINFILKSDNTLPVVNITGIQYSKYLFIFLFVFVLITILKRLLNE